MHIVYRDAMHIDNRYALADASLEDNLIRPGRTLRIASYGVATLAFIVAAVTTVGSCLSISRILRTQTVLAPISLNPDDIAGVAVPTSPVTVAPMFPSYAEFGLSGLSPQTLGLFVAAEAVQALTAIIAAVLVAIACIIAVRRAMPLRAVSAVTAWLGVAIAVGGSAAELLSKRASDAASSEVIRADGTWVEPGFLAGMSAVPLLVGLLVIGLSVSIRATDRFASAAEGVV